MTDEQGGVAVDDLGRAKKKARAAQRGETSPASEVEGPEHGPQPTDGSKIEMPLPSPGPSRPLDARASEIERLVQRGDWRALEKMLHEGDVHTLPASWQVLWAIAAKETGVTRPGLSADAMAIVGVAALLGVARDSATAMVLGKRLVRRRAISQRPAPRPVISWLIVIVGLALGAALGFVLSR